MGCGHKTCGGGDLVASYAGHWGHCWGGTAAQLRDMTAAFLEKQVFLFG